MPTQTDQQMLSDALQQIRNTENALDDVDANSTDSDQLKVLASIYSHLTSVATSLSQAETIADDQIFSVATQRLKAQANTLKVDQATIKKIVDDAAMAGKIVGYLAQAVALIAKL